MKGAIPIGLAILIAGGAATYVWRLVAVFWAGRLDPNGRLLLWVRAVATALVAALAMRIVITPAGLLAQTSLNARLAALAIGVAVFFIARRRVEWAVAAAVLSMLALGYWQS